MDAKKGKTRKESTPIKVWVTPEEKAAIAAKADAHSLSASSYLRRLGLALPVESTIDQRAKLCAILEHELGLAQDNHQRGQIRGNDVTPKSGQESFQAWLQRHAQGFIDATSWEEFHGIADAHGVRLDLRANGFVFTHRRSLIHVKASSIDRQLAKTALEARLGTFVPVTTNRGGQPQVKFFAKRRIDLSSEIGHPDLRL